MSSRINLNDNTKNAFEFTLGGLDYDLKYPTMEDIEPIQDLIRKNTKLENDTEMPADEKEKALKEVSDKLEDLMYGMIVPVGHDMPIKDTLKKQPFPVVKAFNKMMREQLSAD